MRICILGALALAFFCSSTLGSNELIEKYRHHYLDLQESDVDSIIRLLSSPDSTVRQESANLMGVAFYKGFASAQKAMPALIDLVANDTNESVRCIAASAISRSRDEGAGEVLSKLVTDESLDPGVRASFLRALTQMGVKTGETMRVASENMYSTNSVLRFEAIKSLWMSDDRNDHERLLQMWIELIERPDTSLLNEPPQTTAHGDENRYEEFLWLFYPSLRAIAFKAPDLLEPILSHKNPKLRLESAKVLVSLADPRCVPALIDILLNEEDWRKRAQCPTLFVELHQLGALGDKETAVVSALTQALDDKHVEEGPYGPYKPVADGASTALEAIRSRGH